MRRTQERGVPTVSRQAHHRAVSIALRSRDPHPGSVIFGAHRAHRPGWAGARVGREPGALSLTYTLELDSHCSRQISQLSTKDVGKLHGLLLSLAALAAASSDLPDPTADGIKHQVSN